MSVYASDVIYKSKLMIAIICFMEFGRAYRSSAAERAVTVRAIAEFIDDLTTSHSSSTLSDTVSNRVLHKVKEVGEKETYIQSEWNRPHQQRRRG